MGDRFRGWLDRRREARRVRLLTREVRDLKDALWRLTEWSFADSPSRHEDRYEDIYRRIRRVEELGGDALDLMPFRREHLCREAMPETFERLYEGGSWKTRRLTVARLSGVEHNLKSGVG
jgi:hypothetical protein